MLNEAPVNPLISIIVPVYNAERYLRDTLTSLLSQTYGNIEVIAVDDGSTDDSVCIIDDLRAVDDRLILVSKRNGGVSSARNVGIAAAAGKYCMFVDGDDLLPEDAVEILFSAIDQAKADISAGSMLFERIDEGEILSSGVRTYGKSECIDKDQYATLAFELYKSNIMISSCSKLYSIDLLHRMAYWFDENLSSFEDYEFVLRALSSSARIMVVDDICYRYQLRKVASNSKAYKKDLARQMANVGFATNKFCDRFGVAHDSMFWSASMTTLFTKAMSNIERSDDDRKGKLRQITDLATDFPFSELIDEVSIYQNRYACILINLLRKKRYGLALALVRFRNQIRNVTGQHV